MACRLVSAQLKRGSLFEILGYAASVDELTKLMEKTSPDVAVISATLQNGPLSGLNAASEICRQYPKTQVIVLIDRSEPELVVSAFRAGARGVFSRDEARFSLLRKCVFRVHGGQIWADTKQMEILVKAVAQTRPLRIVDANGTNLLTKREEDLLHLAAEGLGNREIARRLNLSEHTVKNYMFRIFEKLGISNRVELVLYAQSSARRFAAQPSLLPTG